ncbi:M1 family metallopeptidase [Agriterribacter sp.]|uniref:M1 family metallopeptidase n=1 Tax=Agriterribacter sp. TaxID=2821509 RepID=UPI002BC65F23|nr:M1 family metallopeptidase [Agriterribacter sp.]HRP56172.1 M1 family metallopeptidase [Agriterribacter sp.]
MRYRFVLSLLIIHVLSYTSRAQPLHQKQEFTRADTLRGTITPERAWWDVTHYDLSVHFDFNKRSITGYNIISYKIVSAPAKEMQIDLQLGLDIDSILYNNKSLSFRRENNTYFVAVPAAQNEQQINKITVYYHGIPRPALRPPWDGGVIWSKDKEGNPWISVACQGLGASVWYPCKDHQSDEPDSASLSMIVPDTLTAIANGRLRSETKNGDGTATYIWAVKSPINNYNIIPYIGKYAHWHEDYKGEKGPLDCDFWVLEYNLEKAKLQFRQVMQMLHCFEHWFGPYPFYEDGYKLIEAPHLGMEHQSAVAYGNGFANGYRGTDLSGTGWGLKWDFIIVHESGHEWFGNNITTKDVADMWVHEGFANYSETIFTDCEYGTEAGNDYVIGTRKKIRNDKPIEGPYGVNQEGSGDMYYKGGNLVHMIRQIINNDSSFRMLLRGMNETFYHQTVTGKQIEEYISKTSGIDLSKVFDQYVRTTQIPVLEYKINGNKLSYRWTDCVKGFNMPLKINFGGEKWISPTEKWKTLKIKKGEGAAFSADRNFYIRTKQL